MLKNAFDALATENTLEALRVLSTQMKTVMDGMVTVLETISAHTSGITSTVSVDNFPISSAVSVSNFPETQPVSGSFLTNTQLRESPIPVSGTINGSVSLDTATLEALETITISNQISQPLTDSQLRSSDVKVSLDGEIIGIVGSVEIANDIGNAIPVSGMVAFSNTNIEISNDVGNPIPVTGTVSFTNTNLEISNDVGNPIPITGTVSVSDVSTETTLSALKSVADNILAASQAIKTAVEDFNTKTTVMNTEAVFVENDFAENSVLQAVRDMTGTLNAQLQQLVNVLAPVKARGAALSVEFAQGASQPTFIPSTIVSCTMGISSMTSTDLGFRHRIHEPWNNSDMGATRLYDQIKIS